MKISLETIINKIFQEIGEDSIRRYNDRPGFYFSSFSYFLKEYQNYLQNISVILNENTKMPSYEILTDDLFSYNVFSYAEHPDKGICYVLQVSPTFFEFFSIHEGEDIKNSEIYWERYAFTYRLLGKYNLIQAKFDGDFLENVLELKNVKDYRKCVSKIYKLFEGLQRNEKNSLEYYPDTCDIYHFNFSRGDGCRVEKYEQGVLCYDQVCNIPEANFEYLNQNDFSYLSARNLAVAADEKINEFEEKANQKRLLLMNKK